MVPSCPRYSFLTASAHVSPPPFQPISYHGRPFPLAHDSQAHGCLLLMESFNAQGVLGEQSMTATAPRFHGVGPRKSDSMPPPVSSFSTYSVSHSEEQSPRPRQILVTFAKQMSYTWVSRLQKLPWWCLLVYITCVECHIRDVSPKPFRILSGLKIDCLSNAYEALGLTPTTEHTRGVCTYL